MNRPNHLRAILALSASLTLAHGLSASQEGGGLPQLNVHTYPSQIFWLVLCFGVLYLLTQFVFGPQIDNILRTRQNKIDGDIAKAEALALASKKLHEQAQLDQAQAISDAKQAMSAVMMQVQEQQSKEAIAADQRYEQEWAKKVKSLNAHRNELQAMRHDLVVEITSELVGKVANIKVSSAEIQKKMA